MMIGSVVIIAVPSISVKTANILMKMNMRRASRWVKYHIGLMKYGDLLTPLIIILKK
jgi:hypothetical protein